MGSHTLELGEICGGLAEERLDGPRTTAARLRALFEIERVAVDAPGLSLVGTRHRDGGRLCEVDVLLVNPARRLAATSAPLTVESFYQRRIRLLLELGAGSGGSIRCALLEIEPPLTTESIDDHLRAFFSARVGRLAAWREFAVRARMIGIHPSLQASTFRLLLGEVARAAQRQLACRGHGEKVWNGDE